MFDKITGAFGFGDKPPEKKEEKNEMTELSDKKDVASTKKIIIEPADTKKTKAEGEKTKDEKKPTEEKGFFGNLADKASALGDKIKNAATDGAVSAKQAVVQAADYIEQTAIIKGVKSSFAALDEATRNALRSVKGKLEEWAKMQVEKNIRNLLQKLPPVIKDKLKDKYMCDCVKDLIDDLVDDIWPEIESEIMYELKFSLDFMEKYEMVDNPPRCCLSKCLWCIVAWYRYTTRPVDKTFWQRIRWFSTWVLIIISMFPFYCISPGLLFIDFLMIDKGDEYQLVQFVLDFKTSHFFSFGVVRGVVGFAQYYGCVNYGTNTNDHNACEDFGPGAGSVFILELISLIIMCAITWLAALCLICSEKKGMPKFRYLHNPEDEDVEKVAEKHKRSCLCACCCPAATCRYFFDKLIEISGGRLWCFVVWDIFMFAISFIIFIIITPMFFGQDSDWKMNGNLYWAQFVYGLLSFPFLVFMIPMCPNILTKARPTAYDRDGRCVPTYVATEEYVKKYGKSLNSSIVEDIKTDEAKPMIAIDDLDYVL